MAEGFANLYGKDVLIATSSGLAPTEIVVRETIECMRENGVDLSNHYPKPYDPDTSSTFDLIINMSGYDLPEPIEATVRNWLIRDPIGQSEEVYRESRDTIERQVMQLILQLRREVRGPAPKISAKTTPAKTQ
jgi:protein-tyrosine-phosphatase